MSSYKNNRICYIPEQIIVKKVEQVLNEDAERSRTMNILRSVSAGRWILKTTYATALKPLRRRRNRYRTV